MTLRDVELAALDFETTGLSPAAGDRAVEVAVCRGRYGSTPRVWSSLLDPGRPVTAQEIHGIDDSMVRGQPAFAQVYPRLLRALAGAVVVAHNARFDISFLQSECRRADLGAPDLTALDSLAFARRAFALPSNRLDVLLDRFGIPRGRSHRAGDDARATWHLWWAMVDAVDPDRRMSLADAFAASRPRTNQESRAIWSALHQAWTSGLDIAIDYQSTDRIERTRRVISVRRLTAARVEAWCHLRGAERVFRLDRLRLVNA
jgi:DNA polymerase III epsilon subunit-like protein